MSASSHAIPEPGESANVTPTDLTPGTGLRVVLAGGGSAGHVSPLLALADCLRRRDPSTQITVLGTSTGLETRLVPARGYELKTIDKVVFPRRPSGAVLRLPGSLKRAVDQAGAVLDEARAQVVVGFGGYVSTPAYLAARRRGIPIVVHEANTKAGLANKVGARLSPYVVTTFSATKLPHARLLGLPLRTEITGLDRLGQRAQARAHFGLHPELPTILVTGGSLGAQKLNQSFEQAGAALSQRGLQVLHITGNGKLFEAPDVAGGPPYVVAEYCDRMDLAFAAADLVVSRAGAGMVCELTAVGLPGVYVPLPIGNGEQRFNVTDVVAAGGGLVVDDAAFTADYVLDTVAPLALDAPRLEAMGRAAAGVGHRHADEALADVVTEAVAAAGTRSAS